MARDQEVVTVPHGEIVEATNGDATAIKFQVLKGAIMLRRGTATKPAAGSAGWFYEKPYGEDVTDMAQIAAGSGPRVWLIGLAYPFSEVLVDHA